MSMADWPLPEDQMRLLREQNADLKAKLAHVEADAAAMRQVLEEVAEYEADEAPCIASDAKAALATGSGQRLLDELALVRRDRDILEKELLAVAKAIGHGTPGGYPHETAATLRATAHPRATRTPTPK